MRVMAGRGLCALVVFMTLTAVAGLTAGWTSSTFFAAEGVTLVLLFWLERWLMPNLDRREQGNHGEIKVGAVLEEQGASGWRVLHDVSTGRGNIDHLLVGPGGILTVETKSQRGNISVDSLDRAWLNQAYAQRKWVERVTGHPADALLVFSDAYLDRPVSRRRGVCVLPARMLAGHLQRRGRKLNPDEVSSIHSRLAAALTAD